MTLLTLRTYAFDARLPAKLSEEDEVSRTSLNAYLDDAASGTERTCACNPSMSASGGGLSSPPNSNPAARKNNALTAVIANDKVRYLIISLRGVFTQVAPGADISQMHNVTMPPFLTAAIQGSKTRDAA